MWITVVAAAAEMYNQFTTTMDNCYDKTATLIYDRNTNQLKVEFTPTLATECFLLPRGVEAQLIMKNVNLTTPLKTVLTNFSYGVTNAITFFADSSVVIDDEDFAQLAIYSFSMLATVSIFHFEEQKSALDQCFENQSSVLVKKDQLAIRVKSTQLCTQQFTSSGGNDLTAVQLKLNGMKFDFSASDLQDLIQKYQTDAEIEIILNNVELDILQTIRSSTVQQAVLLFSAQQGSLQVSFQHSINNIKIEGIAFDQSVLDATDQGQKIVFFASECYVNVINDEFVVQAENSPLYLKYNQLATVNALDFDSYSERLTVYQNDAYFTLSSTVNATQYVHKKNYAFRCDYGSKSDKDSCLLVLRSLEKTSQVIFDIQFFKNGVLTDIERTQLSVLTSCWRQALLSSLRDELCVQLVRHRDAECVFESDATVLHLTVSQQEAQASLQTSIQIRQLLESVPICLPTGNQVVPLYSSDTFFRLDFNDLKAVKTVISHRNARINYKTAATTVFTISGCLLAACICNSIYGMVKITRQIKEQRRKARKM